MEVIFSITTGIMFLLIFNLYGKIRHLNDIISKADKNLFDVSNNLVKANLNILKLNQQLNNKQ